MKERILKNIESLKSKDSKLYFFVTDTENNATAGIAHIYRIVKALNDSGYTAYILHEKDDYVGVQGWMGEEYSKTSIQHISFDKLRSSEEFKLRPCDFFIVPELYVDLIRTLKKEKLPCEIVVLCQAYKYIYKHLELGESWKTLGVQTAITTCNQMKIFIEDSMLSSNVHIISPYISESFHKWDKPQHPVVSILSRNPEIAEDVVKMFFQKYPQYRWIPFNYLSKFSEEKFAEELRKSCLAVWLDAESSFGTFPLEAMKSGVTVMGITPKMIPEWMATEENGMLKLKNNGIWKFNELPMVDAIANYIDAFLTDNIPEELLVDQKDTYSVYNKENFIQQTENTFKTIFTNRINMFNTMLESINTNE